MFPKPRSFVASVIRMPRVVVFAFAVTGFMAFGGGPANASHVSCGDLITEDTKLDSDLSCDIAEPRLTIAADGVTLDLGGHSISVYGGVGVLNDGHDGVTIRDGSIGGVFGTPILIRHADGNRLERLSAGGGGLPGLVLDDSDENRVARSSFGAEFGGVTLTNGSDRNVIERNRLAPGLGPGISVSDSDNNLIRRNLFNTGLSAALDIRGGSDNTTVTRNEFPASSSPREGILVRAETTNTLLVRNQVSGGFVNGIRVDSPSTTLTRNSSNDNVFWGILAVPGVIDGGHNTASGNGVGQCLNVNC